MSAEERQTGTEALSTDNISAAVGKLLEHPELISMVASVLGGTSPPPSEPVDPIGEANDGDSVSVGAQVKDAPDIMASLIPMLSKLACGGGSCRHEALLCALKPYVSASRCEAIDYILKISRMSSLVKGLK